VPSGWSVLVPAVRAGFAVKHPDTIHQEMLKDGLESESAGREIKKQSLGEKFQLTTSNRAISVVVEPDPQRQLRADELPSVPGRRMGLASRIRRVQ
jgi:hypothetical protein